MARVGNGAAWGSFLAGLASMATLPLAIYVTRFSGSYDLLHAGFFIPVGVVLGGVALTLERRTRRSGTLLLARAERVRLARIGRVLGFVGLCLAAAAVVSLAVFGILEYVGSRD